MRRMISSCVPVYLFSLISLLLILTTACSSTPKTTDGRDAREKDDKNTPLYYDFGDVLIPRELKLDVYNTSNFTAGILAFKSKAELNSMVDFFENNMAKDNWQTIGTFKSPRTLLLFQKQNRWCVINITDRNFDTLVEIWVAPLSGQLESGLLK